MMSLGRIRSDSRACYCNARNLNYLIQSDDFEIVLNNANPKRRQLLETLVLKADTNSLRKLLRGALLELTPFHIMSIRQLRVIGQQLQLRNYYNMNKATLLKEIEDEVKRRKENSDRVKGQSEVTGSDENCD